ncbi:MAG TPA: hypothetical protein VKQ30_14425 [Ktedonobacterales bacterium]|nr:hypothetical protein [Ktedonobacterales bacterium]
MATTDLYLQTWGITGNLGVKVAVDPALIQGYRGVFGPALLVPFETSSYGTSTGPKITLHSLEGVNVWNTERGMMLGLRIPSQVVGVNTRYLPVPVTDEQIEEIEKRRNGEAVMLRIALTGLATVPNQEHQIGYVIQRQDGSPTTEPPPRLELRDLHAMSDDGEQLRIEREQWLKILEGVGFGMRRLVELPQPTLPAGDDTRWAECMRLLNSATQAFRSNHYEDVLSTCRKIIEGVTEVLCNRWGIVRDHKKPITQWAKDLPAQLATIWPHDPEDGQLFAALLTTSFKWTNGAHHYGSGIPLREEVSFALSLTTDLLVFGAQVLSASSASTTP